MDKSKVLIMLDNGHGSNTAGKRSVDGRVLEWKYTRDVVRELKRRLEADGYKVYLVHPEDREMGGQSKDLVLRTTRANAQYNICKGKGMQAVFVSVHLNAAGIKVGWNTASGWTGWVARGASEKSRTLARIMWEEAEKRGMKGNRCVPEGKYLEADFWVLRKTNMPAVLTENMFMDSKGDVEFLLSREGFEKVVEVHRVGLERYVEGL